MAYEKTIWEPREGYDLDRFEKSRETNRSVVLRNSPVAVTRPGTPFSTKNMNKIEQGIFDAHEMSEAEAKTRQGQIDAIKELIPNQASPANKLTDTDFVNSSVSNISANYVTPNAAGDAQFASLAALRTGPWFHGGTPYAPTRNDYAIFMETDGGAWRAAFNGNLWSPTYKINDTAFTANQLAALNSNITQALTDKIAAPDSEPTQNSEGFVKSGGVWSWFGAALSALKTTVKTVIGAINELFDTTVKTTGNQVIEGDKYFESLRAHNLRTGMVSGVGQGGHVTIAGLLRIQENSFSQAGHINPRGILAYSDIGMTGNKITDLAEPVNPQDAATKEYVDNINPSGMISGNRDNGLTTGTDGKLFVNNSAGMGLQVINLTIEPNSSASAVLGAASVGNNKPRLLLVTLIIVGGAGQFYNALITVHPITTQINTLTSNLPSGFTITAEQIGYWRFTFNNNTLNAVGVAVTQLAMF